MELHTDPSRWRHIDANEALFAQSVVGMVSSAATVFSNLRPNPGLLLIGRI